VWYLRCTAVRDGSRRSRRSPEREAAAVPTGPFIITELVRVSGCEEHSRTGLIFRELISRLTVR
jgi:hypothetical protein